MQYQGRTIRAIDMHTHVPKPGGREADPRAEQKERYFRGGLLSMTVEDMAALYRELEMIAVIFDIDKSGSSDEPFAGNDYVAEVVERYPDLFIGWCSVDPHNGAAAVEELERAVTQLRLRGLKLHPTTQKFYPNEEAYYPLWAKAQELGIPVVFHTGHTGIGAGTPGGTGLKQKYSQPIPYLDDVAADFPDLTIIGAHPSWPWQDQMLSICMHKSNVYIDLSGWSPKYFQPQLIQYANTLLKEKVMFGSDFPVLDPRRWLKDFEDAGFREEVKPGIMLGNAAKLLGLAA